MMLYSFVEILPREKEWVVSFSDLEGQRQDEGHLPNSLGFYYYPRKLGKKKAFETLKKHLIENHIKKISKLTESLEKLHNLEAE